jgi:gluconokinase
MGVTGSGKTTIGKLLSNDLGWKYFDADNFHSPANVEKMARGIPLTDEDRKPWLSRLREVIAGCLNRNESGVLACSALKKLYRDQLVIDSRVRLVYLRGD